MILFSIKIYRTIRRIVAARHQPHQVAWGIATGAMLGLMPHGNLLAVAVLAVWLALRINHAAMGLVALGVTMIADRADPATHRVGTWLLDQSIVHDAVVTAWQYPLVPWTDINNTIVLGSFALGLAGLVPIFSIVYPILRVFAPRHTDAVVNEATAIGPSRQDTGETLTSGATSHEILDRSRDEPAADPSVWFIDAGETVAAPTRSPVFDTVDDPPTSEAENSDERLPVQTRIDMIREKAVPAPHATDPGVGAQSDDDPTIDQALNYLLRQLRDKTEQQRTEGAA